MKNKNNTRLPDTIHHVAIQVSDIQRAVDWYTEKFKVKVTYQDETWAMLQFNNISLALVLPEQHPPHIAIESPDAEAFGALTKHRDGTRSVY
ncbi:MAG: VOC family protein, partial [Gammaproteobacteria bacterium]